MALETITDCSLKTAFSPPLRFRALRSPPEAQDHSRAHGRGDPVLYSAAGETDAGGVEASQTRPDGGLAGEHLGYDKRHVRHGTP